MSDINAVCVFCGSKNGFDPTHEVSARRLGELMAERSVTLVYGGGRIGLMGVIADSILAKGGKAIGIIPEFLMDLEVGHESVTKQIITNSMHERKKRMFELSDGFVVLPGGLGTLDETLEIITWKQLQIHSKPIVVLNTNDFWSPLSNLVHCTVNGGFAHPAVNELYSMVENVEDVFPALVAQPKPKEEVLTSHL